MKTAMNRCHGCGQHWWLTHTCPNLSVAALFNPSPSSSAVVSLDPRDAKIEALKALLRRTLPMADALDATKTAAVWTADLQVDATNLAKEIRAALKD